MAIMANIMMRKTVKNEGMIFLDTDLLINSGKVRVCYQHPANSDLVIKIPVGNKKKEKQANIKELKGYQILMREHVDLFCISHCYGFVSTDRGKGLVCDCIRDDDGSISKTIWDVIVCEEECDIKYVQKVAEELCSYLTSRDIFIFDLNLKNIALKVQKDMTYQPVVLDLKGRYDNNEFIPWSSYIPYFARKKLLRRCRQLIDRISTFREQRTAFQAAEKTFRTQHGMHV